MAIIAKDGPHRAAIALRAHAPNPRWVLPPILLIVFALVGFALVEGVYAARALPGLMVSGVPVGSLDAAGVRARLATEISADWSASAVTLRDGDRSWSSTNGDLGIALDLDAATRSVLDYGKNGSIVGRVDAWIAALSGRGQVSLPLRATDQRLERWIAGIAASIDRPAVDGEIRVTPLGLTFRDPARGRAVEQSAAVESLLLARRAGDRDVALAARDVLPSLDSDGYDAAASRARALVTPLIVRAVDAEVAEDAAGLSTLVQVERVAVLPGELPYPADGSVVPEARYRYEVALDESRVREWIGAIARMLDRPARSAGYRPQPDGTLVTIPAQSGIRIDQPALYDALMAELSQPSTNTERVFTASANVELPKFTTEQANQYVGRMRVQSAFTTYYPPNASRHANISTGAAQFDGVVIEPGGTFSFWDLLGPVTVERGYAYAGAIINNRSDESVIGGGLCQVSTTMFMAVASAGYQVDERSNHGYFIDRYPVGLDAAVFLPGSDFRWTNDTAEPVVIRSFGTATSVTFEIYGAPTGRQVFFSQPIVSNLTNVSPNQPADPAFAPGAVVLGRDVVVSRTVSEGGKVLHADTWRSHYVPVWGGPAPIAP